MCNFEIILPGNERDEIGETAREIEANRRANNIWDSEKEEEIEEYYRRKYAEETSAAARFGQGGEDMGDEITQQSLLPGVKDPNLWMMRCRLGEENWRKLKKTCRRQVFFKCSSINKCDRRIRLSLRLSVFAKPQPLQV